MTRFDWDDTSDLFVRHRFGWMQRAMLRGYPVEPKTGDLGPVREAVAGIVDAASGLEYSREQVRRVIAVAQAEFDAAASAGFAELVESDVWAGRKTPAVYYEFYNAVAWTRAVKDRYADRLHPAVRHDPDLWKRLQIIRSSADTKFEDARLLAKCSLHKYTPPYTLAGPKITEGGKLIYLVPRIVDADDPLAYFGTMSEHRHVISLVTEFWDAVSIFVERLLDVFYPTGTAAKTG
jgi:hypothetical protein